MKTALMSWNDSTLSQREALAADLMAPLVGLEAHERAALDALLAQPVGAEPTTGDAYAAFVRTYPVPSARLEQARAQREDGLVAEIEGWFGSRWRAQARAQAVAAEGVGVLAAVAEVVRAMSLPLEELPDFLGDHLGTTDPVTGDAAEETLGALVWRRDETRGLVVSGLCPHPALDVAIRAGVDRVTRALVDLVRVSGGRDVPLHAEADLGPALLDGRAAYVEPGVRFLLAEDRIRTLLMGENLYRRSGLALRELYQNAVDACRHRGARLDFLERTTGGREGVETAPAVTFTQDRDEHGRAFIECVDTGIGMGLTEIRGAFCQAGIRSADLPEYLEELEDFRQLDPPVRLWTNSRFGIGALSYFMLADEITVVTTRTQRDGSLGHTLRVHIPSAGTYFRIEDLGPGTTPGTTVRLSLRDGVEESCVEELRSVVVVAPYELTAVDSTHELRHTWAAGELDVSSTALDGSVRALNVPAPAADGVTRVWFTPGQGGILADGLWAGETKDNVVVNLEGQFAPQLSVDRTEMISFDVEATTQHLLDAVPTMAREGEVLLQLPVWLLTLAKSEPTVADALFVERAALGPWPVASGFSEIDAAPIGIAARDDEVLSSASDSFGVVGAWRTTAMLAAGVGEALDIDASGWSVEPALPSDSVLLSRDLDCARPFLPAAPAPSRIAYAATVQRRTVAEVLDRLRVLGFDVAEQEPVDEVDRKILDGLGKQIKSSEADPVQVDALDLIALATSVRITPAEVVDRCARYGVEPDRPLGEDPVRSIDLLVASTEFDGRAPWLDREATVSIHHLFNAAAAARLSVGEVRRSLVRMGYEVAPLADGIDLKPFDSLVLSRDGDGKAPWIESDEPVSIAVVAKSAQKSGLGVEVTVGRLRELGFVIAPDGPAAGDRDAQILLSVDLDGQYPWLRPGSPITQPFVGKAAARSGRTEAEVREFYRSMGFAVGEDGDAGERDAVLTSRDLDSQAPYLAGDEPVAAAHLCGAAARTGMPVASVAERLVALGYRLEEPAGDDVPRPGGLGFESPKDTDLMPGAVQSAAVVWAAGKKRSVSGLREQIAAAGYPLVGSLPDTTDRTDLKLVTRDLDGLRPLRDLRTAVGRVTLLCIARKLKLAPVEVAERMRRLGYVLDVGDAPLPASVGKKLFSALGGKTSPGARLERRIPADVVLECAARQHMTVADVCRRLSKAGVAFVDPRDVLPVARPGDADIEAMGAPLTSTGSSCRCGSC